MRRIFLLALLSVGLLLPELRAQGDSVMTLKQCVDYALQNSTTVQNASYDEYIAKAKANEIRAAGLPQITGNGMIMHNPKLQPMFMTPQATALFAPGAPIPDEVQIQPNFFQTPSSGDINLSATQLLFSGSYFVGLQAAKAYADLTKKSTELSKVQVVENVTKAYYLSVISMERAKLLDANIRRLDSTRVQMRAMNQQGVIEKLDVDRMEVTYNNLTRLKTNTDALVQISIASLKFQMNYDINKPLVLAGTAEDIRNEALSATAGTKADETQRIEYNALKMRYQLEKLNLRSKRMGYVPTLALFGKAGYVRNDLSVPKLFQNTWYGYGHYGLSLTIPIFDGMDKYYKVQQSKIEMKKVENEMRTFSQGVQLEAFNAETQLKNGLDQVESEKRNVELAREVLRVTKIKYEQGIGSNIELVNAETDLKEAETNYYNALYTVAVAKVDYLKANGNLYKE